MCACARDTWAHARVYACAPIRTSMRVRTRTREGTQMGTVVVGVCEWCVFVF